MKEIFLLKLGEVVLKGANKRQFEGRLRQNIRRRMKPYGNFDVYLMQSTVYVEPMDEEADVEGAWEACHAIFGLVSLCRCRPCEKNVDAIFAAIADKAFPQSHSNYQGGIHAFLKTPVFNASGVDYKPLDTEPTITQKYGNVQGVKIYPTFSSRGYLVMAISLTSYDSGKKREKIYYVNYNRRGQSVLSFNSIFASNSEDALLTLVNNKIESLADDEGMPLHKATRLSANVYARKRGIFFVYQAGEIADESEGMIEIFLSFKALQKHLTSSFQALVSENGDYQEYKPITFK